MTKPSRTGHQKRQRHTKRHHDRRLIVVSALVIAVAAGSIGAMLALQYRSSGPGDMREASAAESAPAAMAPQPLPVYEEPVEAAALKPRPRIAIETANPERLVLSPPATEKQEWRRNAIQSDVASLPGRPRIAVVIDDLGFDRPRGARVVGLPAPLTVAYLPYASNLAEQTRAARNAGHELLVHVPMDPKNRNVTDPGPNALLVGLDDAEMVRRIDWNLSRFSGYVGINNHMGSRFTSDPQAIGAVMQALKARGLMFLDSRTSGSSVAVEAARRYDVPVLSRDVFIDHVRNADAVRLALAEVEQVARNNGHAIAIGHPRDVTIEALAEWLPELQSRGFQLVPLSALVIGAHEGG